MHELPSILAIIGPTASGKTELGSFLAQRHDGEIISADAKQVYRRMDIGTAKEKDLPVRQHLLDIKEPGEQMRVSEYQALAYEAIEEILSRGKLPVLVGGSGMYAESVLNGYVFSSDGKSQVQKPRYKVLKIGLSWDREELISRAEKRLDDRLHNGLIDEVKGLLAEGVDPQWLIACGLEYRYLTEYLQGVISLEDATRMINTATRQFIKRQYTWWRRHNDVNWVDGSEDAETLVNEFLMK